ncbi:MULTISPECIES: class I SAM-dependent methyltransferase [Niastella]|uniref:Class I SAM-dependent methyltransferase n=1 Tax=Niastella soli TaxID=2821487 RepID=A0ABS3YRR7_9BACT|nr:class I SAM-dependent methyltransferase [Niastella soli]MBO9200140.1 class I SAM-dependent methyltransferase [Niastella soli]
MKKSYLDTIVKHYENCLEEHGDSHLGVDWPKAEDVNKRYKVMLDIIRVADDKSKNINLLDFGCGAAHLLQYIKDQKFDNIIYSGLDVSEKFIALCKEKFSDTSFYCTDILKDNNTLTGFDYIVMNGVFTEKRELGFEEMWDYFTKMLTKVFSMANKGVAFNVMSTAVDWERDDLFHVPTDLLIKFLTAKLTRNFIIRNDYGLYEYTTYIYKK